MPYLVINDQSLPAHYYTGAGFLRGVDTSVELQAAKQFPTLKEAAAVLHGRGDLYRLGWRVVPA